MTIPQVCIIIVVLTLVLVGSFYQSDYVADATRTGYVAIAILPLVVLLSVKVFGFGTWMQIGYASLSWAHRWLGRIIVLISTLHVVAYFILFARTHSVRAEMSKRGNILAMVSYFGLLLLFVPSLPFVRNRHWHFFKAMHHAGIACFIIGLDFHSANLRPWIITVAGFLIATTCYRLLSMRRCTAQITALPHLNSTLVHIPSIRSGWISGQHVRLRALDRRMGWLNLGDAHPFTIATAPLVEHMAEGEEGGVHLIVKSAGDWTQRLFQLAQRQQHAKTEETDMEKASSYPVVSAEDDQSNVFRKSTRMSQSVIVTIEGPFGGRNLLYEDYESVVLVAGGSGISYVLGVANGILAHDRSSSCVRSLHLVWCVRGKRALEELLPELDLLQRRLRKGKHHRRIELSISLFDTSAASPKSTVTSTTISVEPQTKSASLSPASVASLETDLAHQVDARQSRDADPNLSIKFIGGRPDFDNVLRRASESAASSLLLNPAVQAQESSRRTRPKSGRVAVSACGPEQLVHGLQRLCWDHPAVDFHPESFSL